VTANHTATQVRDYLSQFIDSDDRIFVIKSGVEAAWRQAMCKNEWLKEHL
jgi:hypothetical protein